MIVDMYLFGASDSTAKTPRWLALCIISLALMACCVSALPMNDADSIQKTREQWSLLSKPSGFLTVKVSTTRESSAQPTKTDVPISPEDPEPCAALEEDHGASPDAFLHSDTMRRLIGDLATCRDDLFTLRVGDISLLESSDKVVVNKAHWRSCREALFTLIRWLEQKREERALPERATESPTITIPWSRTRRAYPPPMAQKTWRMSSQVAHEDTIDLKSTYQARCKKYVCDFPDLAPLCSQNKKNPNRWDARLCEMCYPPNDKLIEKHCEGYTRPEGDVYFFLIGLLLTFVGAAGTLVWFRYWREKRRVTNYQADILGEPSRTRKQELNIRESSWRKWDPRESELLGKIARRFRNKPTIDVEDKPLASGNAWTSQPLFTDVEVPTPQQNRQQPSVLYHEIPVMPEARSSGIQSPVDAGAAANGSLHQRFASADGIETVPRIPLYIPVRSSSVRQFGSSP